MVSSVFDPLNIFIVGLGGGFLIPLLNRLGRAYEAIGSIDQARSAFRTVLTIDPTNKIAAGRLRQLERAR